MIRVQSQVWDFSENLSNHPELLLRGYHCKNFIFPEYEIVNFEKTLFHCLVEACEHIESIVYSSSTSNYIVKIDWAQNWGIYCSVKFPKLQLHLLIIIWPFCFLDKKDVQPPWKFCFFLCFPNKCFFTFYNFLLLILQK